MLEEDSTENVRGKTANGDVETPAAQKLPPLCEPSVSDRENVTNRAQAGTNRARGGR